MKRGTIIFIVTAAVCIIAVCALILTGVIPLPWKKKEAAPKAPVFYVEYTNYYMLIGEGNRILSAEPEMPEGVPKISGISYDSIVVGKTLVPSDEAAFAYAQKVLAALGRNELFVNEIYISSDLQAILYVNNVKILLGTDSQTEEKLNDLRDFFNDVKDLSGTLNMQELSHNNIGYSFKQY